MSASSKWCVIAFNLLVMGVWPLSRRRMQKRAGGLEAAVLHGRCDEATAHNLVRVLLRSMELDLINKSASLLVGADEARQKGAPCRRWPRWAAREC